MKAKPTPSRQSLEGIEDEWVIEVTEHTVIGRKTLPLLWDTSLVADKLVQAFVTLDRLPHLRGPRLPGGHWPNTAVEWADQIAQAELEKWEREMRQQTENRTVIHPSAAEITQMETAFGWLSELRAEDSGMALVTTLWALRTARGMSIKRLCWEKKWVRRTFFRKREKALKHLVTLLNARAIPVF